MLLCFAIGRSGPDRALAEPAGPPPAPIAAWQKLDDSQGIQLFRGENTVAEILPFKAKTILRAPINRLLMVLFDYGRKKEWAPKLMEARVLSTLTPAEFLFEESYATPWPAEPRLFHLKGWIQAARGEFHLIATNASEIPASKTGYITSDVKYSEIVLRKIDEERTEVIFIFIGHLGGWIPTWLNNALQKVWPQKFLQGLEKQANKKDLVPTGAYQSALQFLNESEVAN